MIPVILINGARKIHIVQRMLTTRLKPLVENRASIFEKCYPVTPHLAQEMLSFTYKFISAFGYWDPVKVMPANASERHVLSFIFLSMPKMTLNNFKNCEYCTVVLSSY